MKRILSVLMIALVLLSTLGLIGCDESKESVSSVEEKTLNSEIFGTWEVIEGGDEHTVTISSDGYLTAVDGNDTFKLKYTYYSSNEISLKDCGDGEFSGFYFKLSDGLLIRTWLHEDDETYVYAKTDGAGVSIIGKWKSTWDLSKYMNSLTEDRSSEMAEYVVFEKGDVVVDVTFDFCEDGTLDYEFDNEKWESSVNRMLDISVAGAYEKARKQSEEKGISFEQYLEEHLGKVMTEAEYKESLLEMYESKGIDIFDINIFMVNGIGDSTYKLIGNKLYLITEDESIENVSPCNILLSSDVMVWKSVEPNQAATENEKNQVLLDSMFPIIFKRVK